MIPIDTGRRHGLEPVDLSGTETPGGTCPACGEPLFTWVEVEGHLLDRCENCGLGRDRFSERDVAARMIDPAAHAAGAGREAVVELPNAASLQATIGAESWAGLHLPDDPVQLTLKALELLAAERGLELAAVSYPAPAGMASMLGTIFNLLTFNRDFARRALRRELRPGTARAGWAGFAIDSLVTVFAAAPVALLAVLLEGGAIAARRGGVFRAQLRRRR